jgi:predicted transglutaminase-like cysteine proteinase
MCRIFLLALFLLIPQLAHAQTTPFGLEEVPLPKGKISEKWERATLNSAQSEKLGAFIRQFEAFTGRELVARVNLAVNLLIHPMSDEKQWGEKDHWSSASETMDTEKGDCEDYAILKYITLRRYMPADNLRVIIGEVLQRKDEHGAFEEHAFVEAKVGNEWLVLDGSVVRALVADTEVNSTLKVFNPTFSLSEKGVYLLQFPKHT